MQRTRHVSLYFIVFYVHFYSAYIMHIHEQELMIKEACINVVVHGFNHEPDGYIKLQLSVNDNERLLIKVIDQGKPFTGP